MTRYLITGATGILGTNFICEIIKQNINYLENIEIYVIGRQKNSVSLKERLNKIYSKHTGKAINEISEALERDNFMTADEAKKFGLIDSVVEKRK